MMTAQEELARLRPELRYLRIRVQQIERFHLLQKDKANKLEEENHRLHQEINQLEKEKNKLAEELEKVKRERDSYKGMVFKSKRTCSSPLTHASKGRERGGQLGHKGYGKELPEIVDKHIHAHLTNCPNCDSKVQRTSSTDTHTVTDIPHWSFMQPITTEYSIERQWCSNCQKEVRAQPAGIIKGSKLGINLVTCILVWKYRFRDPLNKIAERLHTFYKLKVSEGSLVDILKRAKDWLGPLYDKILLEIRQNPVKHADETGWRVGGENWWCWTGVSPKSTYYTIEETRGGGIAREMFEGSVGVLVRDDYVAYEKLPLPQQSCWAHLLRKSHEASVSDNASDEVKDLHKKLKTLFDLLTEDTSQPFNREVRLELYGWYLKDIEKIIRTNFECSDTKRIQTRIRNQNVNLLTALLYDGVPLTNNAAERAIRPMVVTRKISGGSKTPNGAKTHAVNMSVIETIVKRKLSLLNTLQQYLLKGGIGKN
jgi:transposase/FtsZ-binding cell division protein ZapB